MAIFKSQKLVKRYEPVVAMAICIVIVSVAWVFYKNRRGPLLLRLSKKVLDLNGYTTLVDNSNGGTAGTSYTYQWLDDGHLLLARTVKHNTEFIRFNIVNHHSVPLTGLSAQFNRHSPSPPATTATLSLSPSAGGGKSVPEDSTASLSDGGLGGSGTGVGVRADSTARLSPDGRWLLWDVIKKRSTTFYCSSIDGSKLISWQLSDVKQPGPKTWLPGSRRWIVSIDRWQIDKAGFQGYELFSVDNPKKVQFINVSAGMPCRYLLCTASGCYLFNPGFTGAGKNDPTLITKVGLAQHSIHLTHHSAYSDELLHGIHDELPDVHLTGMGDVAINRRGRMAAIVYGNSAQFIVVGKPDDSVFKNVGYIPIPKSDNGFDLSEIRWLPDCSHLSFVYNNALYTLPAQ